MSAPPYLGVNKLQAPYNGMNRQMRGEELHGLNVVELQELEKSLEAGLSRVLEKKVGDLIIVISKSMYAIGN